MTTIYARMTIRKFDSCSTWYIQTERMEHIYRHQRKLVRLGIPADEIQFIQCATTRGQEKLFEEMNNGKVRVLFGELRPC